MSSADIVGIANLGRDILYYMTHPKNVTSKFGKEMTEINKSNTIIFKASSLIQFSILKKKNYILEAAKRNRFFL